MVLIYILIGALGIIGLILFLEASKKAGDNNWGSAFLYAGVAVGVFVSLVAISIFAIEEVEHKEQVIIEKDMKQICENAGGAWNKDKCFDLNRLPQMDLKGEADISKSQ